MLGAVGVAAAGLAAPGFLRRFPSPDRTAPATAVRHGRCSVYAAGPESVARAVDVDSPHRFLARLDEDLGGNDEFQRLRKEAAACGDEIGILLGLGPRLVTAIDDTLPGTAELPTFDRDTELPVGLRSGDLVVMVESSSADLTQRITGIVESHLGEATRSWSVAGRRKGQRARNAFGFHDEVVMPSTADEIAEHVLIPDGPAAGGTVCAVRLLDLDVSGFSALPVSAREAAVGRHLNSGAPLSGHDIDDPIDLQARHPDGRYVIPERSHVRAAHPLFTGSTLMLRRSYDVTATEPGHFTRTGSRQMLFVSFQRDIETFVATQRRLDTSDDLMAFAKPAASATFLMLPLAAAPIDPWLMPSACGT